MSTGCSFLGEKCPVFETDQSPLPNTKISNFRICAFYIHVVFYLHLPLPFLYAHTQTNCDTHLKKKQRIHIFLQNKNSQVFTISCNKPTASFLTTLPVSFLPAWALTSIPSVTIQTPYAAVCCDLQKGKEYQKIPLDPLLLCFQTKIVHNKT